MKTTLIAHNIRSSHNVGSILRTADGFGVDKIYLSGYSPYPAQPDDERLPHIRRRVTQEINKTALGADKNVSTQYVAEVVDLIKDLKRDGYQIIALEQSRRSIELPNFKPLEKWALLLGEETKGITSDLLEMCDEVVEIPMKGRKESFNVSVAAGIAMYQLVLKG